MIKQQDPETNWEKFLEFYDVNKKRLKLIFKLTFWCIVLILFARFSVWGVQRYLFNRDLNRTVHQISQLVDNVRTTYAVNTAVQKTDIMRLMVKANTVPDFLVRDGRLINVYGGGIVVASSTPIMDGPIPRPTFKIAYQGLRKDVCMALSALNWGTVESGLIAEAVGYVDETGTDTALRDLEEDNLEKSMEVTDKKGRKKTVVIPPRRLGTVARPADTYNPTPFNEVMAEKGCACKNYRSCTFALRYYTYN
ncbi:MAG: hypothetical protein IKN71_06485 [Alphaproteobacteria bacterium]|nr:hypothetical protein [Alphaproteobacteria bacterium]